MAPIMVIILGIDIQYITISLLFLVPPEIDNTNASPVNNTVVKSNRFYLDCPVSGIPRPKVIWYKDGEVVSPDLDPNLRVLADGRRLEVVGARVTDAGLYKCVGENVAGKTEKDFDVDVHGKKSESNLTSNHLSTKTERRLLIFSSHY